MLWSTALTKGFDHFNETLVVATITSWQAMKTHTVIAENVSNFMLHQTSFMYVHVYVHIKLD